VSAEDDNPLIRKLERIYPLVAEERAFILAACTRRVEIRARHDIVREGDRPTESGMLLEGMAFRYKILADGRRQIFSFHTPGDMFDAQSFLLEQMDHGVAALTRCSLASISHRTLHQITERFPNLTRAIWKDTLIEAAILREWMASIGCRSSYERIAHLMCEMVSKYEVLGLAKDGAIDWPITQLELGDALGMTAVHVNRTLQQLRADGLITLHGRKLVVLQWEELKRVALFAPRYLHASPREFGSRRQPSSIDSEIPLTV
jgi:CRP-like cAMP-binding protein